MSCIDIKKKTLGAELLNPTLQKPFSHRKLAAVTRPRHFSPKNKQLLAGNEKPVFAYFFVKKNEKKNYQSKSATFRGAFRHSATMAPQCSETHYFQWLVPRHDISASLTALIAPSERAFLSVNCICAHVKKA